MSKTLKLIIPLLNDELNMNDLSKKCGFIDAYTNDINRPYLDNHIFLLYYNGFHNPESIERHNKLISLNSLHSYKYIELIGKSFILYTFTSNKTINNIKSNCISLSDKEKMKIFTFWNFTDTDINNYMLDPLYTLNFKFTESVVPEEDYKPNVESEYDEKSGALLYKSTPL